MKYPPGLILVMLLIGYSSNAIAQTQYECALKNELNAPLVRSRLQLTHADVLALPDTRFNLHEFLVHDKTDDVPYHAYDGDEKTWFVCNQFAHQLFLRASAFVKPDEYALLEQKTPIRFLSEGLETSRRLPLFILNITNYKTQYSHAVNALYLGSSKGDLAQIASYLFIEPQNDSVFINSDQLIRKYFGPTNRDPIEIAITLPTPLSLDYEGGVQYNSIPVATFNCSKLD